MKKLILLFLCTAMLCSCSPKHMTLTQPKQYTATFLESFDTVTTIVGKADSEEAFKEKADTINEELKRYHKLFDIYHEYEGINNLKTLNDKAALSPVKVDSEIIELLLDSIYYYTQTGGAFNPAMGSVLSLWHEAREDGLDDPENAYLPKAEALEEAAKHTDPDDIVIDKEASTVFFSDPDLKLDVGAIAKGWAVERICKSAPSGLLLSVGGNVSSTGPKDSGDWAVGIRKPDDQNSYIHVLNIHDGCVVTSGSYQRAYAVDGALYHHIIDPKTLYPSKRWVSVSVVSDDSGLADVLSTALFVLSREEGQALLDLFGAHAMWVDTEQNKYYSPDFRELIRN